MKLMISSGVFYPRAGGAESLFRDLSRLFVEAGHEVTVITRRVDGTPEESVLDGVRIRRFDYPVPYERFVWGRELGRWPAAVRAVHRELRAGGIDTVCIGLLDMSALFLLLLKPIHRFRLVTYLHGGEIRYLPHRSDAYRRLLRATLRSSDAVVAVSDALASEARRYCPRVEEKTRVLPNGIDLAAVDAAEPRPRDRPFVLYVGRLTPDKNAAEIVRAFALVANALPAVDLVLVGDGPERKALERLAAESHLDDRIVFLGQRERPEVYSLMKAALFQVLASPAEGHPIAVLEAMAAGTPVIGARVRGTSDVIEDGSNGALFDAGDVEALAHLIRRYAEDEAARDGLRANLSAWDRSTVDIRRLAPEHLGILAGH